MKIAIKTWLKDREWREYSRLCLYSCLFLMPGLISLIFYGIMHITCNIILVYLLVDGVILLVWTGYAYYQLKKEKEERSLEVVGDGLHHLKRKVSELKDIEK